MTEKKLKTLAEHNSEKLNANRDIYGNKPVPNGISCPICQKEMMDSSPMMVLTSIPPKKSVHCPSCDYRDYRIA
jgi:C4-type Zn-finger protein